MHAQSTSCVVLDMRRMARHAVLATPAELAKFLLELFDIPPGVLPEIRDTDAGFGVCAAAGLDGVPILASLVDQPAALAGHGCLDAIRMGNVSKSRKQHEPDDNRRRRL